MIQDFDPAQFKTFRLPNNMVFFGQIAYVYKDVIHSKKEEVRFLKQFPDDVRTKVKKVRHGFGVEIQMNDKKQLIYKYEGYWENDIKMNQAKIIFQDGSSYSGTIKDGEYDGHGDYHFSENMSYVGGWLKNRMHGGGKFSLNKQHTLQGIFENNYYTMTNGFRIHPFMNEEQQNYLIKNQKYIQAKKEKNYDVKLFQLKKLYNDSQLKEFFQQSAKENRVPFLLSSSQFSFNYRLKMGKQQIYQKLQQLFGKSIKEYDIRKASISKDSTQFMIAAKLNLAQSLVQGHLFAINIDDSDIPYSNITDPDICKLYHDASFPQSIWNPKQLKEFQCMNRIVAGTEFQQIEQGSQDFQAFIWSKFKLDQKQNEEILFENYSNRFDTLFEVKKFNLGILCQHIE